MNKNPGAAGSLAFFLIHGYTGSPTDFNGLPKLLERAFGATVVTPLLPGNGTKIEDLEGLTIDDFILAAERSLRETMKNHERVIVVGHSFGGHIALYLAARYRINGVITTSIPYRLKFPFNIPGISLLGLFKKRWKKKLPEEEQKRREHSFYYKDMPAYGMTILSEANELLREYLPRVNSPLLTVQATREYLADLKSIDAIQNAVRSSVKEKMLVDHGSHGIFYSGLEENIYAGIVTFVERHCLPA